MSFADLRPEQIASATSTAARLISVAMRAGYAFRADGVVTVSADWAFGTGRGRSYAPRPFPCSTSAAALPPALLRLSYLLAKDAHDAAAATRIAEGWHWGPVRDEAGLADPALLALEWLPRPAVEAAADTAAAAVHFACALGYVISKDEAAPPAPDAAAPRGARGSATAAGARGGPAVVTAAIAARLRARMASTASEAGEGGGMSALVTEMLGTVAALQREVHALAKKK